MVEEVPLVSWGNISSLRRKKNQEKMDRQSCGQKLSAHFSETEQDFSMHHANVDGKNRPAARRPSYLVIKAAGREKKCLLVNTWNLRSPKLRVRGKDKERCTLQINQISSAHPQIHSEEWLAVGGQCIYLDQFNLSERREGQGRSGC